MTGIILHHYEASPFSEKVRAVLGYKQLEWQSVLIPRIMPKPDLLALTGGYRKTPVMQIGRDVYADTHLITRQIEALAPEPSVFPTSDIASSLALEQLGDKRLFLAAVPVLFRPAARAVLIEKLGEEYLARFGADRAALFKGGHVERPDGAFSDAVLPPTLQALDTQLANRDFLLGEQPRIADFAAYHPLWYIRANSGVAPLLDDYPNLLAWADRIRAFGHGQRQDIEASQALDIAAHCSEWQPLPSAVKSRLEPGTRVAVAATDYGTDPTVGELVSTGHDCVTIERDGPGGTPIRVHFPRDGFQVSAVSE
jgi:glutathione S-transferase